MTVLMMFSAFKSLWPGHELPGPWLILILVVVIAGSAYAASCAVLHGDRGDARRR